MAITRSGKVLATGEEARADPEEAEPRGEAGAGVGSPEVRRGRPRGRRWRDDDRPSRLRVEATVDWLQLPAELFAHILCFMPGSTLLCMVRTCQQWADSVPEWTEVLDFSPHSGGAPGGARVHAQHCVIASYRLWPSLRTLDLPEGFNDVDAGATFGLHSGFREALQLGVDCSALSPLGVNFMLSRLPQLSSLTLIQPADCSDALRAVAAYSHSLRIFSIYCADEECDEECMECSPASVEAMGHACPHLIALQVHALGGVCARSISACQNLRVLDLEKAACEGAFHRQASSVRVGSYGIDSLRELRVLSLHFGACPALSDDGLADIMAGCPHLTSLTMYGLDLITGAGFETPAGGCRLQRLAVSNCIGITPPGLESIGSHPLVKLAVREMDLPPEEEQPHDRLDGRGVAAAVALCPEVVELNVHNDGMVRFSADDLRTIAESCPRLRTLIVCDATAETVRAEVPSLLDVLLPEKHPSEPRLWYEIDFGDSAEEQEQRYLDELAARAAAAAAEGRECGGEAPPGGGQDGPARRGWARSNPWAGGV